MLNQTLQLKVKLRANKIDSQDYDNVEPWIIAEAWNKAQISWCRRQLVGTNILKQGDEQSERRIDDLEILLSTRNLTMTSKKLYDESNLLPPTFFIDTYLAFKRLEVYASSECCKDPRLMTIYPVEEANIINYLTDENKKPSFAWGETISTIVGRRFRIYTNGEFITTSVELMYYRQPRRIQIAGSTDPYTGLPVTTNIIPEFKDDICELLVDEAAGIITGDIENWPVSQNVKQRAEQDN